MGATHDNSDGGGGGGGGDGDGGGTPRQYAEFTRTEADLLSVVSERMRALFLTGVCRTRTRLSGMHATSTGGWRVHVRYRAARALTNMAGVEVLEKEDKRYGFICVFFFAHGDSGGFGRSLIPALELTARWKLVSLGDFRKQRVPSTSKYEQRVGNGLRIQ